MYRMWVPLWRKSQDSTLFQDDHLWKMWTWFLMKMAYENTTVMMKTGRGTTPVDLTPGQLVVGRTSGAKALGWTGSNYRNRLKKLKTMKKVTIQPDTHWSIISVVNWEAYKVGDNKKDSRVDTQEDRQRTGKGQASGHKEEVKNLRNKEIKDMWNDTCLNLSKIKAVSPERHKRINARGDMLKTEEDWREYFTTINSSPFLCGDNDRGWKADFDWVLNETNMVKVLEGKYENSGRNNTAPQPKNGLA